MTGWHSREPMVESILSRAAKKLSLQLIQEPGLLSGIEEDVNWIYLEMSFCIRLHLAFLSVFTVQLRDVAYDVEDVIDDLTLKSAWRRNSRGIDKKLKQIEIKMDRVTEGIPASCIEIGKMEDPNMAIGQCSRFPGYIENCSSISSGTPSSPGEKEGQKDT